MNRFLPRLLKFGIIFCAATFVMAMIWEWGISVWLYDCTDDGVFGYFTPGNWIHGSFQEVDTVTSGRSMSEPDTIKRGWTLGGIWALWLSIIGLSLGISWRFSREAPL